MEYDLRTTSYATEQNKDKSKKIFIMQGIDLIIFVITTDISFNILVNLVTRKSLINLATIV